jgi:phospholipase C
MMRPCRSSPLASACRDLLMFVSMGIVEMVQPPHPVHIQPNGQPKIKHMVVMLMENRAADHFFGCMAGEGVIGLDGINGSHYLPKDPNNASAGGVNVTCGTANYGDMSACCCCLHRRTTTIYPPAHEHMNLPRSACVALTFAVCDKGPPYSPYLNKFADRAELGGDPTYTPKNYSQYPYGPQDDKYSYNRGARLNAIQMFNSTQLPIKTAIAKEFAVFNHLHSSVPSYSIPNHLYWGFGSSCGLSTNPRCSYPGSGYEPPAHIFDSLHAANVSYRSYSNDSAASPPTGGNASGTACPQDLMSNASRRHKDHCFSMDQFYKDAAAVRTIIATKNTTSYWCSF